MIKGGIFPALSPSWARLVSGSVDVGERRVSYLSVEARVLVRVADVHWQTRGRHQLGDAVVDQPIGIGGLLHAVFETRDIGIVGNNILSAKFI